MTTSAEPGPPRSARSSRLRAACSWLAASVFSLLVLEAFLRITNLPRARCEFVSVDFDRGNFEYDARLFWRLGPTVAGEPSNAQGMRGFWPEQAKQPNEYRIVCVGDSCTFGTGVTCNETYGMQLAGELGRVLPGKVVRCILLALPGYSTYQSRVLIERHAADLHADLVVFYTGAWNDYLPALRWPDAEWGRRLLGQQAGWRIGQLCGSVLDAIAPGDDPAAMMAAFAIGGAADVRRVPRDSYLDNLSSMIRHVRSQQAAVMVVIPPMPEPTRRRFPIAGEYREATQQIAAQCGVPICDVEPEFHRLEAALPARLRAAGKQPSPMFSDEIHPSAFGHRLLARVLTQRLLQVGVLPTDVANVAAPADTATHLEVTANGSAIDIVVTPVAAARGYILYYVDTLTGGIGCAEIGPSARIHIPIGCRANFLSCASAYAPSWVGELSNLCDVQVPAPPGPLPGGR